MRTWLIVLALVSACHKEGSSGGPPAPAPPASPAGPDALWAMAPDGATLGVVVTPRAIAMADHALADIRAGLHAAPELAAMSAKVDAALTEAFGSPTGGFAAAGIAPAKGGAFFVTSSSETVLIVPLGDRDKFLAKVHGTKGKDEDKTDKETCKTVRGYYTCVSSPDLFAHLGKGDLKSQLGKLGTRGEIEAVASDVPFAGAHVSIVGAIQLARGAVTVHGLVHGLPPAITSQLGTPSAVKIDPNAAGFVIADLGTLLKQAPPLPIVSGVTATDLAHAIGGPLAITMASGALAFDMRMPLSSTAPFQTLLAHCTDIPPLAQIGATDEKGTCRFTIPLLGTSVEASVDGAELHITGKPPAGATAAHVAMTETGKQLAAQPWTFAFWGRGTMYAVPPLPIPALTTQDDDAKLGFRIFTVLDELGLGARVDHGDVRVELTARSVWANPDDVVAKLAAISTDDVIHGRAGSAAKAIADAAPSSPFAADYHAGVSGLAAPASIVGVLAAVAIPAFMDYTHKAKTTEAELELNKIRRDANVYYIQNESFPKGDAPLTPATSCCNGPGAKCPVDAAQWQTPVWQALDFSIDEPNLFRYSYHSDGQTATALAVGDLDCDGTEITYRLDLSASGGNPTAKLTTPPPDAD